MKGTLKKLNKKEHVVLPSKNSKKKIIIPVGDLQFPNTPLRADFSTYENSTIVDIAKSFFYLGVQAEVCSKALDKPIDLERAFTLLNSGGDIKAAQDNMHLFISSLFEKVDKVII